MRFENQQRFEFASDESVLPPGLIFVPGFLSEAEEAGLLEYVRGLAFKSFVMRGVEARRRVAHFGFGYSFDSRRLTPASPIPEQLQPLRERVASLVGVSAEEFSEALITEYQPGQDRPGAGIGWHRDAPPFGIVVGISLGSACQMRFRDRADHSRVVTLELPPRSLYVLDGAVRSEWEHMIPPVKATRYSITFRTLKQGR